MAHDAEAIPPVELNTMKLKASSDQSTESLKALAQLAGTYFAALLAQGLERDEALTMVAQWQDAILDHVRPKP